MGTFWEACQPPKVWKEGFGAEGRKRRRERELQAERQAQPELSDADDAGSVLGSRGSDGEEEGAEDRKVVGRRPLDARLLRHYEAAQQQQQRREGGRGGRVAQQQEYVTAICNCYM